MIEIVPAIDIIGGECVRLTQGDYAQKSVYYKDPADAAQRYADAGVRRLHLVDLDGAKASEPRNLAVLERVARRTGLDIQYGGGIKSAAALASVLDAGAARAICGSIAVGEPELFESWLAEFGSGRIILGADTRDGKVATHGWLRESTLTAGELIGRFATAGLTQAIVTDISRDGMLAGPAFELYAALQRAFPEVEITASGGISCAGDIARLDAQGTRSVIVGKALYENRITLEEISKLIK
ncbi:MAG: 1-(5-phosphoribosyl)-5-[(5-phosphoribosylamino)methylideneamino]imidazole-4-carboxamide isomerase [Alistipes sp.]|jgi:phosphoribosylformimino-5-aminoimidazole carboxamide ribotide isomerase|nr:1-(5-phosphoribosyl)-5-[(5-phosphoribosylamino)methylideneamino]imidazole-4-carboxamide isomerase [Alistipes sp.]